MKGHVENTARDGYHGYRSWKRWIILIGLFLIMFFEMGTLKSFGVFISSITSDLHATTGIVGFALGLSHGITYCLSPINVPLMKRCSIRLLLMVGGFLGAFAFVLSSFARNVIQFTLTLALSGLGYSLVIVPAQTSVVFYFPDHFEMASAVTLLGGGFGMMVLPPVSERMTHFYGWRGTVMLLGALNLQSMVTGALMNPDETKRNSQSELRLQEEEPLIDQENEHRNVPIAKGTLRRRISNEQQENTGMVRKITCFVRKTLFEGILQMFDLRLLRDYPTYIFIFLTMSIYPIAYCGWIVFVIPNAVNKGIILEQAVYVAIAGGVANVIGRIGTGFVTARLNVSPWHLFCFVSLVSAMAFFANFFTTSLWCLCLLAAMNGLPLGVKPVTLPIFCKEIIPQERFAAALSLLFCLFGIMEGVGGFLIGRIYDVTKSFDVAFSFMGATNILEAILIVLPYLYRVWAGRRTLRHI